MSKHNKVLHSVTNKYVGPPYSQAEMYAVRITQCPYWVTVNTLTGQTGTCVITHSKNYIPEHVFVFVWKIIFWK